MRYFLVLLLFFMPLQARLYFIHIPKTAGTTLRTLLEFQVSDAEIYPYRNRREAVPPISQELVSGHLPYWLCKRFDPQFEDSFKVTILREPVDRYLSFLRAKKRSLSDKVSLESILAARDTSGKSMKIGLEDNSLCRTLASSEELEGQALLDSAKRTLDSLDAVLFFENFSEDVVALFHRFGIDLPLDEIPKLNATRKEEIGDALLQEVTRLNALDIQLYEYAKNRLLPKQTTYPLRSSSYNSLLVGAHGIDYRFDQPLDGYGWSNRDGKDQGLASYRWVTDEPAVIRFQLEAGKNYELTFHAQLFHPEVVPQVLVNRREVPVKKLDDKSFATFAASIPSSLIKQGKTEITFFSQKSFRYWAAVPLRNLRHYPNLSFAVNHIGLCEATPSGK